MKILLLIVFILIGCKNEKKIKIRKEKEYTTEQKEFLNLKEKDTMREKFDFDLYENKTDYGRKKYTKLNGNVVLSIDFKERGYSNGSGGGMDELISTPPFIRIYKTFYIDGYIKEKKYILGKYLNVGISEYYDKYGKLTQVDEDKQYGKIKPDDVLKFIEKKGIINLKTGEGFFIGHPNDAQLSFNIGYGKPRDTNPKNNCFIITLKYKGGDAIPDSTGGEPLIAEDLIYIMDGETGEVFTKEEFDKKYNSKNSQFSAPYRTHNGKTYTEEEWKAFEEQEYQKYVANKTKKGFWERLFGG